MDIYIVELEIWITAYVLQDPLPILSIGKLCRIHGFVYVQNGCQNPVLYDNKFTQATTLRIRNDIPFMLSELTNEPMNKTPINSPRPGYNALNAESEMQAIIDASKIEPEIEKENQGEPDIARTPQRKGKGSSKV